MSDAAALLPALTQTAGRLAEVYGARAEAAAQAGEPESGRAAFDLFERAFFAYRVGLNLELRLIREARAVAHRADHDRDRDHERLETEPAERLEYTERDRDRDTERASFPLLLKTLGGLVADAEAMPGPHPAELVSLRELLATAGATPAPKARLSPLKTRLAGSTSRAVTLLDRPPRPPAPLALRRATGPPRR